MTPTIEQAIEIIRQLPPPEQAKLRDWIDEESQKNSFGEDKQEKLKRQQERFQFSMKWIQANREEFDGQWVALEGDISFGTPRRRQKSSRRCPSQKCENTVDAPCQYQGNTTFRRVVKDG